MEPPRPADSPLCPDAEALLGEALAGGGEARQILADWLEENGQAVRAELLRLHDALARVPAGTDGHDELSRRAAELQERIERAWLSLLGGPGGSLAFERGLVVRATLEVRVFLARWEEILRHTWARQFDLFAGPPQRGDGLDLGRLAACAGLGRVRALDLRGQYLGAGGLAPLLRSPHLGGLRHLDLSCNALGEEGAERVGLCGGLAGLEELSLGGNLLGDEGLRGLLAGGALRSLRALGLCANSLTDDGMAALDRPGLRALAVLDLSRNVLTARGVGVLGGAGVLGRLTALDLSDNFLGDEALALIAGHADPQRLASVALSGNPLSRRALIGWAAHIPGVATLVRNTPD